MKKIYFLTLLLISNLSFGQGLETFTNSNATSSYTDNNFVGDNAVTWTYKASRDQNADANSSGISGKALMLRYVTTPSKVTSSAVAGGIGDFSVKLYKGFTSAGNRQVELFVNGISRGTSTVFDDNSEQIFTVTGINQPGNVIIELVNITSKQIIVDDISWTGYAGTATPSLTITSPSNATVYSPITTSVNIALAVSNFNVATGGNGGDGHIHYTINAAAQPMKYNTTPIAVAVTAGSTYVVYMELVDNAHTPISPAVNATVTFEIADYIDVATIAALRGDVITNGLGKFYNLTGEAFVTYARTNRNQKYIQDATAAVLIDDATSMISTTFIVGDGMTGLKAQTSSFLGLLQLNPLTDVTVSSTGTFITPEVVTASMLNTSIDAYESELVRINESSFTAADGVLTFAVNTNFVLNDSDDIVFRTSFAEANYINQIIPLGTEDRVVLVGRNNASVQVTSRNLVDVTLSTTAFNAIEGLKMYPNPLSGNVLNFSSAINAEMNVQIFDMLGKQISTSKVNNNTINISNLNAGIYIVKITEEGKTATRKLVVK